MNMSPSHLIRYNIAYWSMTNHPITVQWIHSRNALESRFWERPHDVKRTNYLQPEDQFTKHRRLARGNKTGQHLLIFFILLSCVFEVQTFLSLHPEAFLVRETSQMTFADRGFITSVLHGIPKLRIS